MRAVGLGVGIAVLLVTIASQTGLMGGHDFVSVALFGLAGAALCLGIVLRWRTRAALAGLTLSLLPVALLIYYLATSDG